MCRIESSHILNHHNTDGRQKLQPLSASSGFFTPKFHESFCQDLPPDEALVMAVTQRAPVGSTFADKVTVPAWKSKPSWYQISSEDRMIAPANEKRMAERMGAKKIITLSAGHASLASVPTPVSALIDEAAKATS